MTQDENRKLRREIEELISVNYAVARAIEKARQTLREELISVNDAVARAIEKARQTLRMQGGEDGE